MDSKPESSVEAVHDDNERSRTSDETRRASGATAIQRDRDRDALASAADEPPVVARMVIEIRSDGTRTIARGAAEDASTGEKVAIQIDGSSPLQLALSLMKTIAAVPALARGAMKAFAAAQPPKKP